VIIKVLDLPGIQRSVSIWIPFFNGMEWGFGCVRYAAVVLTSSPGTYLVTIEKETEGAGMLI
jgi:hypothetical protein